MMLQIFFPSFSRYFTKIDLQVASFKEIVSVDLELHHRTVPETSNLS